MQNTQHLPRSFLQVSVSTQAFLISNFMLKKKALCFLCGNTVSSYLYTVPTYTTTVCEVTGCIKEHAVFQSCSLLCVWECYDGADSSEKCSLRQSIFGDTFIWMVTKIQNWQRRSEQEKRMGHMCLKKHLAKKVLKSLLLINNYVRNCSNLLHGISHCENLIKTVITSTHKENPHHHTQGKRMTYREEEMITQQGLHTEATWEHPSRYIKNIVWTGGRHP
jgi:hypothetical protein